MSEITPLICGGIRIEGQDVFILLFVVVVVDWFVFLKNLGLFPASRGLWG